MDPNWIKVNGLPLDGGGTPTTDRSAEAAALQAESALANLTSRLAADACSIDDICKITVRVVDRSLRTAVYPVIGRHLRGVYPVSTGLVLRTLSQPGMLVELEACVVRGDGAPHQRFRKYHSRVARYGLSGQNLDCEFCMAVRAGRHVFLRGQTGVDLDEKLQGIGDAGAQAEQAMKNVRVLLREAGAELNDVTHAVLYVIDRAHEAPARAAVVRHLGDATPALSVMIVDGLASAELLMEIDIHAMVVD